VTIIQGGTYTELGATATDNVDGDITGSIVIDASAVDTSTVGSYTVTYNVSDTAGNAATEVITLNGANTVTIIQGGTYTELGATATDNVDGDITGSIVIDASAVDTSTVGSYTVTYNVSDTAGNAATEVTRTVNVIASLVFADNFDTDTLGTYTLSVPPSADTWREQLRNIFLDVLSGSITLSKTLDTTVQQGHFSLQFKPITVGSYNGQISIYLKQDDNNYYQIILGNGNGKNLYIAKTINGVIDTDNTDNTVSYKADTNNKIDITFGPRGATVTALGTIATINTGNIPLNISSFEIFVYKTTAYIDNISLNAQSAKNIQIMTPHPGHIQTGDTIEVNATADTGKTVTLTLNGVTKTATETSGVYSASFIVNKGDYSIDANISGQTGFRNVDHIDHIGRGDIYVALGDSISNGDYDDDLSDDNSTDGRVKSMGFVAILSDTLSLNRSYPVVVLNEGIGGEQSKGGASRLTDVITSHPEANTYLIMYGTNDASNFAVDNNHSRPSGLGLLSTDGNYTDSFKDHMQQIITTLDTNGKTPVIAKILPVLGTVTSSVVSNDIEGLERNVNIREYNQVIDELSIENPGVLTLGPDFYDDFNTTFVPNFTGGDGDAEFLIKDGYANALHPDGVGYSSMADWWFGTL
jgi:lysophospholipase L1-like esterase